MDEKIISAVSVLIAFAGLYFVVRIWSKWRHINMEVLKARVFLDKKFLERNWLYIFLSGALLTAHHSVSILVPLNYIAKEGLVCQLLRVSESIVLIFLVILAYEWFVLVHKK